MTWLTVLVLIAFILWAVTRWGLAGEDLSHLDQPRPPAVNAGEPPSAELEQAFQDLRGLQQPSKGKSRRAQLREARVAMDSFGADVDTDGVRIIETVAGGVPAEWVLAQHSDPDRRLLYIHGGAFALGSPRSHRRISVRLAKQLNMSVLAIDYRLMPENQRLQGLEDCQQAYRWILEHGPQGREPAQTLTVAGDSAGGNLTLALLIWARDNQLRPADCAVALSPATDGTFASPSLRANKATDAMLGPTLGPMLKLPRNLLLWIGLISNRALPTDPRISPLRGKLHDLPPTLVMASECEMLLDDACRYAHKARQAGSTVDLLTWEHMLHVWQIFVPKLPEAVTSYAHIETFVNAQLSAATLSSENGDDRLNQMPLGGAA